MQIRKDLKGHGIWDIVKESEGRAPGEYGGTGELMWER